MRVESCKKTGFMLQFFNHAYSKEKAEYYQKGPASRK